MQKKQVKEEIIWMKDLAKLKERKKGKKSKYLLNSQKKKTLLKMPYSLQKQI